MISAFGVDHGGAVSKADKRRHGYQAGAAVSGAGAARFAYKSARSTGVARGYNIAADTANSRANHHIDQAEGLESAAKQHRQRGGFDAARAPEMEHHAYADLHAGKSLNGLSNSIRTAGVSTRVKSRKLAGISAGLGAVSAGAGYAAHRRKGK